MDFEGQNWKPADGANPEYEQFKTKFYHEFNEWMHEVYEQSPFYKNNSQPGYACILEYCRGLVTKVYGPFAITSELG